MEECDRASLVLSYADLDPKCDASASRFMAAEAQGNTSLAIPLASAKAKCREHRGSAWTVSLRFGCNVANTPWSPIPPIYPSRRCVDKRCELLAMMALADPGQKGLGTVVLLPGPPVGTYRHLQAEAPHHLIRPQRLPERAATLDRATQGSQLGFPLRGVHQLHPTPGTLQRPGRQP